MKRFNTSLSVADLDNLVAEACLNAAAESIARGLSVTGLLNDEVVTLSAADPRLAALHERAEVVSRRLNAIPED